MKNEQDILADLVGSGDDSKLSCPTIVGPLRGLAYIIALPFMGAAIILLACGYRIAQSFSTMWHKAIQLMVIFRKP